VEQGHCGKQIVGIDLHRRRSVVMRMAPDGQPLGKTRIDNDPFAFAEQIALMGEAPRWCWRRPTDGTGRLICLKITARLFTWRTRWESRDSRIGGSRTTRGTIRWLRDAAEAVRVT
jgi:hypothetical protein